MFLLRGDLLVDLALILLFPLCPHDFQKTLVTLIVLHGSVHALFLYLKLLKRLELARFSLLLESDRPTSLFEFVFVALGVEVYIFQVQRGQSIILDRGFLRPHQPLEVELGLF